MPSKVFDYIAREQARQDATVELIASENFVSENVLRAVGSCLTNKYAEGYPAERVSGNRGRYYGGCEIVNDLEEYCCDKWREVFSTDYHVNVQPHSGSQANMAAYLSVIKPGDTILAMNLNNGGHLTHGSSVNFSGKLFDMKFYDVDAQGFIDYADVEQKAAEYKPKLILAGASAYSRVIDFARFADIAKSVGAYFMVDMAHIAGLVAAGDHPSPFGLADIITTTTHKTLRGPRGGMIFCKPELAKKVDSAVFPGQQGGPLLHVIAGKAVCFREAGTAAFADYARRVVENAAALAEAMEAEGFDLVSGGTDNHLLLVDLRGHGVTGRELQERLDALRITVNKNAIPNDPEKPTVTSGVRIGTPCVTSRGFTPEDMRTIAGCIARACRGHAADRQLILDAVEEMTRRHPLYQ